MSFGTSIILLLTVLPADDSAGPITILSHSPSSIPLQMACDRLAEYLRDCPEAGEIRTALRAGATPRWATKVMPSAPKAARSPSKRTRMREPPTASIRCCAL